MSLPRCTQNFWDDFRTMLAGVMPGYSGTAYAFVRYGDGEAAIISGRPYQTRTDGWTYPGGYEEISKHLCNSLCCGLPAYYVGLPSPTYEPQHLVELLPFVRVPYSRITWAKLFIDTNYRHFLAALPGFVRNCVVVGCAPGADFFVPANGVMPYWGESAVDRLVYDLRQSEKPILVAAGPLSKIIIHRYWCKQPVRLRQTILDVGSALDEFLKGRTVRVYSREQHRRRDWAKYIGCGVDV